MPQRAMPASPGTTRLDDAMIVLRELDRALALHTHWLRGLHRALICSQPAHPNDLLNNAHCHCNFGLWFYSLAPELLAKEPGLAGLEAPHRAMHDAARSMLLTLSSHSAVPVATYESFMDLANEFKQRLSTYQFELVQRVCSVDHLTGAWNRNSMAMQLAAEAERGRRSNHDCALCLLDLDHFKNVNDAHGHQAGDRVLQTVAKFIKGKLRAYDSLFRYGGEEFLICLPNTGIDQAEALLNRVREGLAELPIAIDPQRELRITASFGLAALEPDEDVVEAIKRADHALLCAKSKGRNRVCVWNLTGTLPPGGDSAG